MSSCCGSKGSGCGIMVRLCIGLINFYRRYISRLKPPCCRFIPTCSEYGIEAFRQHGFWKGGWLTFRRILRCHPFYRGALYDPVPPVRENSRPRE